MKILIVSASFYPEQSPRSFRATELAKELVRQGHEVTVSTIWHNEHAKFSEYSGISIDYFRLKKIREISIGGHFAISFLKRLVRRSLDLFFHYPNILLRKDVKHYLKKTKEQYDAIISLAVPFPVHWGVSDVWPSIKGKTSKVWIADCGDPFMRTAHDTFPKMFYFNFFENKFLKRADYVTVPFEEMKSLFDHRYKYKFHVIPQGFRLEEQNLPDYFPHSVPTFIFSGLIIPGHRDPFSLIDFLLESNYDFRFKVYTKQVELFSKYESILGSKIILYDYIPRLDLLKELARADFLLNINTDSHNGKINAIPSKLIDYKISGRPILSYEHSALPKNTIQEFMVGNYKNAFVDQNFDRFNIERVAKQFVDLMKIKD